MTELEMFQRRLRSLGTNAVPRKPFNDEQPYASKIIQADDIPQNVKPISLNCFGFDKDGEYTGYFEAPGVFTKHSFLELRKIFGF